MEKITKIEEVFDYKINEKDYEFDGFVITTDKRQIKLLIDNTPKCCEKFGHMLSHDDTTQFIGADLHSVSIVDTALKTTELDKLQISTEECVFVNIKTSAGTLQFTVYNSHNGYYGHSVLFIVGDVKTERAI